MAEATVAIDGPKSSINANAKSKKTKVKFRALLHGSNRIGFVDIPATIPTLRKQILQCFSDFTWFSEPFDLKYTDEEG